MNGHIVSSCRVLLVTMGVSAPLSSHFARALCSRWDRWNARAHEAHVWADRGKHARTTCSLDVYAPLEDPHHLDRGPGRFPVSGIGTEGTVRQELLAAGDGSTEGPGHPARKQVGFRRRV